MAEARLDDRSRDAGTQSDAARELLNVAEKLFSERGYFGVSIREIVKEANQTLAAVNYHFGSKEQLFASVVSRRASELNGSRMEMLKEDPGTAETASDHIRRIATAFVMPLCERVSNDEDQGWKYYGRLIADIGVNRYFTSSLISPEYDTTARVFMREFASVFPKADDWSLNIAYQFMLGSMLYIFAENGRLETVSDGKYQSSAISEITREWIEYTSSGLIGLLSLDRSEGRESLAGRG